MKKHDHYLTGPHAYWVHFWCGLLFGAVLGAWVGWSCAAGGAALAIAIVVSAVLMAYACGRCGDRAWEWVLSRLHWLR